MEVLQTSAEVRSKANDDNGLGRNTRPEPGGQPYPGPYTIDYSPTGEIEEDPELGEVAAAWPRLPGPIRAAILLLVRSAALPAGVGR